MKKKIMLGSVLVIVIAIGIGVFLLLTNNKGENIKTLQKNLSDNNKILVAYFSHSGETYNVGEVKVGNTKMMANYIIDYLGADSFEIIPDKEYPKDYDALVEEAQEEQRNDISVKYVGDVEDFNQYDIIFIGYPIWDGEIPNVVQEFLKNHNLKGKTVIPFNTHEGSGDAETYEEIKQELNNATILEGLPIKGTVARTEKGKQETIAWLKDLGFDKQSNKEEGEKNMPEEFNNKVNININGTNYTATLEENNTTKKLINKLPLKITMDELNGNEKYYYMDSSLPTDSKRVGKIETGDMMLYGSNCLVIFYDSFSTPYSYTRIGKIDNPDSLKSVVGKGNIEVTINK